MPDALQTSSPWHPATPAVVSLVMGIFGIIFVLLPFSFNFSQSEAFWLMALLSLFLVGFGIILLLIAAIAGWAAWLDAVDRRLTP